MNTVSKITYSDRDGLESQRDTLVEQLQQLQFKLFDKSAPEVVEYVNQLQIEKSKQQSLLKQAQAKLDQLEPELENFEEGAEQILLEAISQQDWYGFRNKREIVFDKRTGILFPNFKFINKISYQNWKVEKKIFSPNGIALGQWVLFSDIFYYDAKTRITVNSPFNRADNHLKDFDLPKKFRGHETGGIYIGKYINNNGTLYRMYGISNFSGNSEFEDYGSIEYSNGNTFILPSLQILNNPNRG